MNRKYFLAVVSGLIVVFFSVGAHFAGSGSKDNPYGYLTILSNVIHLVDANYVEEVDFNKVMDSAISGMVENLDPESFYIKGKDIDGYKKEVEQMRGLAVVGVTIARRFGMVTVIGVEKGSSADENGIKPGDYLRTVDDQYVQALPIYKIYRMLSGAPGSSVKVSLFEGALEKPKDLSLTRHAVSKPYIASYVAQPRIGYIRVNHLLPGVESEIEAKLKSFHDQSISKLILDMRSCSDDTQDTAVKVADLFLGSVPIVQISGRDGAVQKINGDEKVAFSGTLLVLVDYTTSAGAEIVAGAIQDNSAGKVYGTRTYGRGGIQKLIPAGDNFVMLTTQKYLTPKGKVILNNGIDPSIVYKEDAKVVKTEENKDEDRMLNKAIEYLRHPEEKAA